jgi:large subunit ribosomal protein L15
MPIQRRVPKFGFKNRNRVEYKGINIDVIQALADAHKVDAFDPEFMVNVGLASKHDLIKILGRGELSAKITVKAHAFSATAKAAIEEKGGTAELIGNPKEDAES